MVMFKSMESLLSQRTIFMVVLVCLLVLTTMNQKAEANSCATECMNGGELRLPNNIFGFCHCKCQKGFGGPKCQFGKRSAPFGGLDRLDTDLNMGQVARKRAQEEMENQMSPLENMLWSKLLARARLAAADMQEDDHE